MKRFLCAVSISVMFFSCSKENESDSVPQNLQEIITTSQNGGCTCLPYINQYSWRGQTVYLMGFRGPTCNWTPAYYDKNGNPIVMESDYTLDEFLVESLMVRVVWECQ